MHLIVRDGITLDESAPAEDLELPRGDLLMLSFSHSDLAAAAAAWKTWPEPRPALRLADLARLRHPMSTDLFCERTLPGAKAAMVRLLGGTEYWRYGCEELARLCREQGIVLALLPADGRPDPRLALLSTLPPEDLARLDALFAAGGAENVRLALATLLRTAELRAADGGAAVSWPAPRPVPRHGIHRPAAAEPPGTKEAPLALVVFYRSHLLAGDTAPIDALCAALAERGLRAAACHVPSLKDPQAAAWLKEEIARLRPAVTVNATAFSARDGETFPLPGTAGCPVLQVALSGQPKAAWEASARGLNAAGLAMHVVLPEFDGRLFAGAISFLEEEEKDPDLGYARHRHEPDAAGITYAADLAAAWVRLATRPPSLRRVALMVSAYPGRPDQIARAVGLDTLESALVLLRSLAAAGYHIEAPPEDARALAALLSGLPSITWPLADYEAEFARLPEAFRAEVTAAWGAPREDPAFSGGALRLPASRHGNLVLCLQPERGLAGNRKENYHDPKLPPRHAYTALYLWLRRVFRSHALVHLGAHGTLEWLPGKAVALGPACAPRAVLGALPVVYPFIVNDPGEAAQAKRRLGAVTLGHRPPPLVQPTLPEELAGLERLVDEYAAAEGLDPRRRRALARDIRTAAEKAGLAKACGLHGGLSEAEALVRIDAFLCDVKEMRIGSGLHVLDGPETAAVLEALNGRFIAPGPAGAPSRGRPDVLPTGRNMYAADPRQLPTPTAWANGERTAAAIVARHAGDHGVWPRSVVFDLWGSATLRTGGEELAAALALLGVKPVWDHRSFRVTGIETVSPAVLGRPRVDVTLRVSGLFRDTFPSQIALFAAAVRLAARQPEEPETNPLAAASRCRPAAAGDSLARVFGPPEGCYGTGVLAKIASSGWEKAEELGAAYLANSVPLGGTGSFADRVAAADAFVHIQDHDETDLLAGGDFAAHEGGFAAAARSVGNRQAALYHGRTGRPETPAVRTLTEECARVLHGRAAHPQWIRGQMRHGFRGAAELAATVDAAFAFAATADSIGSEGFERLYEAYLGDPLVAAFVARENPAALEAMKQRFAEAVTRGLWHPRRNGLDLAPSPSADAENPVP